MDQLEVQRNIGLRFEDGVRSTLCTITEMLMREMLQAAGIDAGKEQLHLNTMKMMVSRTGAGLQPPHYDVALSYPAALARYSVFLYCSKNKSTAVCSRAMTDMEQLYPSADLSEDISVEQANHFREECPASSFITENVVPGSMMMMNTAVVHHVRNKQMKKMRIELLFILSLSFLPLQNLDKMIGSDFQVGNKLHFHILLILLLSSSLLQQKREKLMHPC